LSIQPGVSLAVDNVPGLGDYPVLMKSIEFFGKIPYPFPAQLLIGCRSEPRPAVIFNHNERRK